MINITETAKNKLKEILKQEGVEEAYIRIYFRRIG